MGQTATVRIIIEGVEGRVCVRAVVCLCYCSCCVVLLCLIGGLCIGLLMVSAGLKL